VSDEKKRKERERERGAPKTRRRFSTIDVVVSLPPSFHPPRRALSEDFSAGEPFRDRSDAETRREGRREAEEGSARERTLRSALLLDDDVFEPPSIALSARSLNERLCSLLSFLSASSSFSPGNAQRSGKSSKEGPCLRLK
jgi:hypothetical protein